MLEWSVIALRQVSRVRLIVVALPDGVDAPEGCKGVRGGAARSESVQRALSGVEGGSDPGEAILIHDAARPLLTAALVDRVLDALEPGFDGAIAAAPVTDTIKRAAGPGAVVEHTLDRSQLWAVQTPQVFRREALERAFEAPSAELAAATDEASLVERAGGRVRIVSTAGTPNLKVTGPSDLQVAAMLLATAR